MPLPLSDKYTVRVTTVTLDPVNDTLVVGSDPARAVLVICNENTAKVAKLAFGDLAGLELTQFVPIQGQLTWSWALHGLLVTARVVGKGNGFAELLTIYELRYTG